MGAPPAPVAARPDRGVALSGFDAASDPFLRWQLSGSATLHRWDRRDGVATLQVGRRGFPVLTVLGSTRAAVEVLPQALRDFEPARVTLPRGALELLAAERPDIASRIGPGDDWEWMWTDSEPAPTPGEDRVMVVPVPRCDPEIVGLLAAASPRHSSAPGSAGVERWLGIRSPQGTLLAVAANHPFSAGVPHLASIAVHPGARGQKLGAAVTAALTRRLLAEGAPVVTLGMYSDNAVARRMYERLGFCCEHYFSSRQVLSADP